MTDRIVLLAWSDDLALTVLRDLDISDSLEAALWRGDAAEPLALFADWRAEARSHSVVVWDRRANQPFALLAITPAGAAGVAQAALLARHHQRHARALARLASMLRNDIGDFAFERGLTRIECRSWSGHPTAGRLLEAIGFRAEGDLAGFGGGDVTFRQYAWTASPNQRT